jgi:hypothetical protein
MFLYEIRLMNRDGDTSPVYMAQCRSDEHAMQQLHAIEAFHIRTSKFAVEA